MLAALIAVALAGAPSPEVQMVDAAIESTGMIKRYAPPATRVRYVEHMVEAGKRHKIDPLLLAAVAWVESRWTNKRVNKTRDRGVMQVHWQRGWRARWLEGLSKDDLYDPRTNINAGAHELAHVRAWCKRQRHTRSQHNWWAHYKYGPKVKGRSYDKHIARVYRRLRRAKRLTAQKRAPARSPKKRDSARKRLTRLLTVHEKRTIPATNP